MNTAKKAKAPASTNRKGSQVNKPKSSGEFEVDTNANTPNQASTDAHTPLNLPTAQQMYALAISRAKSGLNGLINIRCNDEHWDDADTDCDFATELALAHVERMESMVLSDHLDFDREWFKAASAMNLAQRTFSRTDCWYARSLRNVCQMFTQMAATIEFVEARARGVA